MGLFQLKIPYLLFYSSLFIIATTIAVFEKLTLVYVKPFAIIALMYLYLSQTRKVNPWYLVGMVALFISDIFISINFEYYFAMISLLITFFYISFSMVLKDFITFKDFKLADLVSFPIIISLLLVFYMIYSITELIWPHVLSSLLYLVIILLSLLVFVGLCFLIYIRDRYQHNVLLFASACCCLFVNSLLPINELYYYTRVFSIILAITQFTSIFLLTQFLIVTDLKKQFI
ncbi:hypothetical protein NBT05_10310 [Aquimarina sp. ERC-38]|uniref:hypothetical protein n=1 Tax=Aquimarina sp. ERC-38 TaxID=2949996 RepID=UPI002245D6E6|nr:hypothetical protein [Aquimarina sp. ERC-38]UZO79362.1 hypothetical protein NBT05_10310 [Aquimarina sp. ERC-38]